MNKGNLSVDDNFRNPDRLSYPNLEKLVSPLSNPVRQKILILLAREGPLTYTQLLERLNLESGSFYWHIGKMKSLVNQDELKQYLISPTGKKAYELLIDDGSTTTKSLPFRPDWYVAFMNQSSKVYHLPTWIILQQILIILIFAAYLFDQNTIIQFGTTPLTPSSADLVVVLLSIVGSLVIISGFVIISQSLYVRPDRQYFTKSLIPNIIRLILASSSILFTGMLLSFFYEIGLGTLANSSIFQLIVVFLSLIFTILLSTSFVDEFLEIGLKDALLIVLPPYYVLILISFFLNPYV